ncbi:hypothetical protein K6Q96_23785 [Grimontia kaedaensis]|uniref:Uncharacterized protein n=1 Tax=Grimontia kaedaensis TaxID=2872157 RepID=A0ABY4X0J2_9GAMM|nr:hypothetical protein [Grimontia kaedaensis]USH04737.1 hypothetical protein K6Q96_23785 [Grimontia kaedaensis]
MDSIKKAVSYIEFLPIIVFGFLFKADKLPIEQQFYAVGLASMVLLLCFYSLSLRMGSMALATNLHLISGAFAYLVYWEYLNWVYYYLQESSLLAWMFIVALVRTIYSQQTALDTFPSEDNSVKKLSFLFSFFCLVSIPLSVYLRGDLLYSVFIPFAALAYLQGLLKKLAVKRDVIQQI